MEKMNIVRNTNAEGTETYRERSRIGSINHRIWSVIAPMLFVAFGLFGVNEKAWAWGYEWRWTVNVGVASGSGTAYAEVFKHGAAGVGGSVVKTTGNATDTNLKTTYDKQDAYLASSNYYRHYIFHATPSDGYRLAVGTPELMFPERLRLRIIH